VRFIHRQNRQTDEALIAETGEIRYLSNTNRGLDTMKTEYQLEALSRARGNTSALNYDAIYRGMTAKGIPAADIIPRENVLTLPAWNALGRKVKKGETGVRVTSWIRYTDKLGQEQVRPTSGTVFHITQTEEYKK
jgi:hypothetical protein